MLYFASQLVLGLIKYCFNREIAWLDNWIDCCLTSSEQYFSYMHAPNTSHSLTSSVFESLRTDITCPCWSIVVYHIRDTKSLSSNPDNGEVYSIQHYVIKFVWLATGQWLSLGTLVSSTNKTDCHKITEILLKLALNTINQQPNPTYILDMNSLIFYCIYDISIMIEK